MEEERDVNVVIGLFKNFLSGLNEPLFPNELFDEICVLTRLIDEDSKDSDDSDEENNDEKEGIY
jgi:hypothetical protein